MFKRSESDAVLLKLYIFLKKYLSGFSIPSCFLCLTLILLSTIGVAQQNRDPFARSVQPPDIGLGLAYNQH